MGPCRVPTLPLCPPSTRVALWPSLPPTPSLGGKFLFEPVPVQLNFVSSVIAICELGSSMALLELHPKFLLSQAWVYGIRSRVKWKEQPLRRTKKCMKHPEGASTGGVVSVRSSQYFVVSTTERRARDSDVTGVLFGERVEKGLPCSRAMSCHPLDSCTVTRVEGDGRKSVTSEEITMGMLGLPLLWLESGDGCRWTCGEKMPRASPCPQGYSKASWGSLCPRPETQQHTVLSPGRQLSIGSVPATGGEVPR